MPESFPSKPLPGNIAQLRTLARSTWAMYAQAVEEHSDENGDPALQLVGGVIMRVPFSVIWKTYVIPSFTLAVDMFGFQGNANDWGSVVASARED